METKGRRAPRTAAPIGGRAEPAKTVEIPSEAPLLADSPAEPPAATETPIKSAEPAEEILEPAPAATPSAPLPTAAWFPKPAENTSREDFAYFGRDAIAALSQTQAVFARGLQALSAEAAGLTLWGIDTAARTATKMLGVKTLSDAIEVNAGLTCSSLDTLFGSSAKLSELGVKLAAEASQPILTQFGRNWMKASRLGS
jgi:hypothetical protein